MPQGGRQLTVRDCTVSVQRRVQACTAANKQAAKAESTGCAEWAAPEPSGQNGRIYQGVDQCLGLCQEYRMCAHWHQDHLVEHSVDNAEPNDSRQEGYLHVEVALLRGQCAQKYRLSAGWQKRSCSACEVSRPSQD